MRRDRVKNMSVHVSTWIGYYEGKSKSKGTYQDKSTFIVNIQERN
jgi:hypothetical protein